MTTLLYFIQQHRLRLFSLSLWVFIFISVRLYMVSNNLTLVEVEIQIITLLADTWYGPLIYILMYVSRPLFLIPGSILTLIAGRVYGFPDAIPLTITANITSATVTYLAARWLMESRIELEGRGGQFIRLMRRNPFEAVLTMQLAYISLDLTCSLAGILYLPYRPFLMGILIGGSVGNIIGVILGSSVNGTITDGNITIQPELLIISLIVLMISLSISALLRWRHAQIEKDL